MLNNYYPGRRSIIVIIVIMIIEYLQIPVVYSQQDSLSTFEVSSNVDLVSRYIWRGQEYGQSPSIQPGLSVSAFNFSIGAWGAYKFSGMGDQETDFFISKSIGAFTFEIWDYFSFRDTGTTDYFNYSRGNTSHLLEAQVILSGGEKIPFNLLGSYFFYGNDPSKSIYFELQSFHSAGQFDMLYFIGFQAKGEYYGSETGFVNIGSTVVREIEVNDSWSIPLSISLIFNPQSRNAYIVAGVTF